MKQGFYLLPKFRGSKFTKSVKVASKRREGERDMKSGWLWEVGAMWDAEMKGFFVQTFF